MFSELSRYGWDSSWERFLLPHTTPGRVARVDRGRVDVVTGADRVRADVSRAPEAPAVGDWVLLDEHLSVQRVLPRRTTLARAAVSGRSEEQVLAANVDTVLVAAGLDAPLRPGRIERLLTLAWGSGATPVVVLTKSDRPTGDLADAVAAALAATAASAPGVEVLAVSAVTGDGLDALAAAARGTVVLVGPSGAGKSTLGNALLGEEVLAVGAVRERDAKGRHTTVHRELVPLPGGGVLVDTPGLRGIGVRDAGDGIDRAFADVAELARECRFDDCGHDTEPGCAVRAAVAAGTLAQRRVENHRKLRREDEYAASRTDARLAAERRSRGRALSRAQRAFYRERGR